MNFSNVALPNMTVNAGPKQIKKRSQMGRLIERREIKKDDADWFIIESDDSGLKWRGKCWVIYEQAKYEFKLEFEIPPTYPLTPIELVLPELDGKTEKMYRGGKICQDIHFAPHWVKNVPKYGMIHALVYGVRQKAWTLAGS